MTSRETRGIDGEKVARARIALPHQNGKQVSQAVLADRVGCHSVTISGIERGRYKNLTLDLLERLASALRVEIGDILVDPPAPADPDLELADAFDDLASALQAAAAAMKRKQQAAVPAGATKRAA